MKITVRWEVTEQHSAVIEVDDDADLDVALDSHELAELEDDSSYICTTDRMLLDWSTKDPEEVLA